MGQMILIVDDSAMVRKYVRQSLEALNYRVVDAANGPDALTELALHKPSLVISDVNMAPMDGFELVRQIRQTYSRAELPILMLTTEADDEYRARGRAVGANGWLVKPFDPQRMGAVIGHLLKAIPATGGGRGP